MTDSYIDTMVKRHTEGYAARHNGRHPFTDCWPWAEAITAWSDRNVDTLGWSLRTAYLHDGDAVHVVAGIAETLRLNMARHGRSVGDLDIDTARHELSFWTGRGGYPEPGSAGWPEPSGPYASQWRSLFLASDRDLPRRVARGVNNVLLGLLFHTGRHPHISDEAISRLDRYRMETTNFTYVALAQAAPSLGITAPVEVRDPLYHQGIEGLTVVPEPQAV